MTAPAPDQPPPKPKMVQMNVRVPQDLRDAIDTRRNTKGLSRDKWVANALRFALTHTEAAQPLTTMSRRRTAPPPRLR